ncbi:hypothetical protein [Streptomyces sedi]|uniref:Uncharacterized protein n=1 Tax=Streptomyces sedi TaxID=555059 RepID=A0A5C4UQK4_9ACTN|nr:hypothetical protein [Streptomyces sedi]TNM25951.1 hypothetical protein FH715_25680 [Streptomyces sedi]
MARLDELVAAYPWLARLPADALRRLDTEELADPHPVALALGPTVVAYRRGAVARPGRVSLCSLLGAAPLGPRRLAELAEAERRTPGIVLVEYVEYEERAG